MLLIIIRILNDNDSYLQVKKINFRNKTYARDSVQKLKKGTIELAQPSLGYCYNQRIP